MNFQEQEEDIIRKVFGFQKVKLYEIKHFIFDFGGVLIEPTHSIKNLFDIIEDDFNITIPRSDNSYYRKLFRQVGAGIITSRDFIEKVLKRYYYPYKKKDGALPPKPVIVDYYLELWFQLYSKFSHLSIDMEKIVHQLHKAGYMVSLMSNTFAVHVKSNNLKGFYSLFDYIFLSNEIGLRKPDLEKYKYVIKKLKTKPKYCIFIDNKLKNLIPAKQLGMIVLKFESIEKFKEQLKELGIKDISSLSRRGIKNKYTQYKETKREFSKAKRAYKKAKNNYLKTKKNSSKKKTDLEIKYEDYMIKKAEYKKAKLKKKELVSRIKVQ